MIEADAINNKSGTWRIESETGVLREVLMCSPEHFTWLPTCEAAAGSLTSGLPFDHQRVMDQHHQLSSRISESGTVIHWLDKVKTLPDLYWIRDGPL